MNGWSCDQQFTYTDIHVIMDMMKAETDTATIQLKIIPDRNPIRNMWTVLKSQVCGRKHTNLTELYQFCQGERSNIQQNICQRPVDGYQKHLIKLKLATRNLTKYEVCCMYK